MKFGRFRAKSCRHRPDVVQTHSERNRTIFGQFWATFFGHGSSFVQYRLESGHNWSESGQDWLEFDRRWLEFDRSWTNIGRYRSKFARSWSNLVRFGRNIGRVRLESSRNSGESIAPASRAKAEKRCPRVPSRILQQRMFLHSSLASVGIAKRLPPVAHHRPCCPNIVGTCGLPWGVGIRSI